MFRLARSHTAPPFPPSPPSGPPFGTCDSRRNATQPAPPSPPLTLLCAVSTNPDIPVQDTEARLPRMPRRRRLASSSWENSAERAPWCCWPDSRSSPAPDAPAAGRRAPRRLVPVRHRAPPLRRPSRRRLGRRSGGARCRTGTGRRGALLPAAGASGAGEDRESGQQHQGARSAEFSHEEEARRRRLGILGKRASVSWTGMSGFVDTAQSNVKGGDGGAGCVAFRRESHVPKGGPDGGDGGNGGAVWLRANRNISSLLAFRDQPHRKAGSGTHGKGQKLHGKSGGDLTVDVPEGTVVRSMDGELLADLLRHGDTWLAARGGQGGRGNARFLSNARRAPSFAEQGEYGEERWLKLELKLLADAALVGFPNAGKSTLISVVSAAKPKIADYPFTTLEPHLGVVRVTEDEEFVLADIPGLIEGAADGKGLGHRFLRHVERSR